MFQRYEPHRTITSQLLGALALAIITAAPSRAAERWPEYRGPNGNYHIVTKATVPTSWSVTTGSNILWRAPLPETGQSGIAVWDDKLFLTCFRKLTEQDISRKGVWVSESVGYCLDGNTGKVLWSCELPGKRPNQVNGVFTDSTTPSPVTDGRHVWFVSAGGFMACYTLDGEPVWSKPFEVRTKHSAKQFQPFLHDGRLHYVMMRDPDDPLRRKQTAKDYDKNSKSGWPWMHVRSFDALTGKPVAVLKQGISVHSKGARGAIDGESVLLIARGGGHSPPEKPYGLGLAKLNREFDLVWERPDLYFEGTHYIDDKFAYCFDKRDFFVLDLRTGETKKTIPMRGNGKAIRFNESSGEYEPPSPWAKRAKGHIVTHRTNIGAGGYHYFLSGATGFIGRVHLKTEAVEYLQVPLQVRYRDQQKELRWSEFDAGDDTGSGFVVQGDKRRHGHGFGHISAATPLVINNRIYFTTVLGTVYVVDATAKQLDQNALIAVNDLGPPGKTWTLSPFSYANGRLYQRTSREVICIGVK